MAIKYYERFLVYTSDTRGFEATGLKPLFDRLLRGDRPIILFVHGRGKEPAKSLAGAGFFAGLGGVEGKAVAKLEAYGATVVMFSWDSQRSGFLFFGLTDRERALGNTSEGASRFGRVLGVFDQAIAEARQAGITPPSVTLLAHSMGTIVLQRFVEINNGWRPSASGALFTNVILSSADADNLGHAAWVEKIAAVERVFITVNRNDDTLVRSHEGRQPTAVALGLDPGELLSEAATYALISINAHEIFTKRTDHQEISTFFAAAFEGREIPLGDPLPAPGRRFRLR